MTELAANSEGLRSYPWRISYRTSAIHADGTHVDILQDFYIPALRRSVRYDRVAGYFRSTSLAAASQGFSAFVGQKGKMRLIVGADLDPDDVKAILAGSRESLETALNAELDGADQWPGEVSRGVELLSWMVAKGHLEVRVAFRVHAQTGEPLAIDSVDDGYVHMKWGLFRDAQGNRIYISGSLNESRTSLTLNAENIDVHCNWREQTEKLRVEEAEQEFEVLWRDQNPSLKVLSLPDAVRQRLIKIAEGVTHPLEIDGSSAAPREVPPPSAMERLRFAMVRDGPRLPGGRYVGMETAPITPWPHQAVVARRLITTWPYNYLLCDEVGLGKTIEAGLAIRSLYLAGLARRVLICAPASITRQWHREMASKFFLPFGRALGGGNGRHEYLLPLEEERPTGSLYEPDLSIVSTGLLTRKERINELKAAEGFDIALVDEAHYARRKNPTQGSRGNPEYGNLFRVIQESLLTKSRSLLLATATPMQLDPVEAADLLQLSRRVGAYQFDPSLVQVYYGILGSLVTGQRVGERDWEFLRRSALAVRAQDPLFWNFVQQAVIDGFTRLAVRQWLERGSPPRKADLPGVLRLIFITSPLSRVMLRHNRSLLEIYQDEGRLESNLPERKILPIPRITFNDQERRAYDELEAYCKGLAEQLAGRGGARGKSSIGFILSFLRLRFASSLLAIRETLGRRLKRVEATMQMLSADEEPEAEDFDPEDVLEEGDDDTEVVKAFLKDRSPEDLEWEQTQIQAMLRTLSDLSDTPSKMRDLYKLLDKRRIAGTGRLKQTVIFTRFYDTLTDIVTRLLQKDPRMLIGTYSGRGGQYLDSRTCRLVGVDREEIKQRFLRAEIDVLVCTDAAAEGLNLQTADFLVNFDLPWNPMKVEQRIGRIDRIGQKHETVYVLNLCYADSAEQMVYGRLLRRLADAGAVVGTQQISLLPVTREEFQQLAEGSLSEAQLEQRAIERALLARKRSASMEIPPRDLYGIYVRLSEQSGSGEVPVDLDAIWQILANSAYLRDLGCQVLPEPEQKTMTLRGLVDVPDGTTVTTSRTVYEMGLPNLKGRLHFATYGDPTFEAILQQLESFGLPECVRRLEVEVPEVAARLVGYAVAQVDGGGQPGSRLVTSVRDLEDLRIDENRVLSEEETEPLSKSLEELARKECATACAVSRIEKLNEEAARSQLLLALLVARDLVQGRQIVEGAEQPFWRLAATLEEILDERKVVRARLSVEQARKLSHLLFDLSIPSTGEYGYIDAPPPLLTSALEAAYRLASGMKLKKPKLTTEAFVARLDREIDRIRKEWRRL